MSLRGSNTNLKVLPMFGPHIDQSRLPGTVAAGRTGVEAGGLFKEEKGDEGVRSTMKKFKLASEPTCS